MKYVGFLTVHSEFFPCAGGSPTQLRDAGGVQPEIKAVAEYLEKGTLLMGMLHWDFDIDGMSIGPATILTDAVWIWPGYYPFYLRKYCINPPIDLVDHIKEKDGETTTLTNLERMYAEYCLAIEINSKLDRIKIPPDLQYMINTLGTLKECY